MNDIQRQAHIQWAARRADAIKSAGSMRGQFMKELRQHDFEAAKKQIVVPTAESPEPDEKEEKRASKAASFYNAPKSDSYSSYSSCEEQAVAEPEERFIPSKLQSVGQIKQISHRIESLDKSIESLMGLIEKRQPMPVTNNAMMYAQSI